MTYKIPSVCRAIHHEEVITCDEAAAQRNIRLATELKTLLLRMGHRTIALHLRGCDRLSRDGIRSLLPGRSIRMFSQDELADANLASGTIHPWNTTFCQISALCLQTLNNRYMTTNAGNRTTGIFFPTKILLELPKLVVGYFGEYRVIQ